MNESEHASMGISEDKINYFMVLLQHLTAGPAEAYCLLCILLKLVHEENNRQTGAGKTLDDLVQEIDLSLRSIETPRVQ